MLEDLRSHRDVEVVDKPIENPRRSMVNKHRSPVRRSLCCVLRAGWACDGMTKMIHVAEVGFLGVSATRRTQPARSRTRTVCPTISTAVSAS